MKTRAVTRSFIIEVQLFDKSVQKVFYDKLTYIYLEMPKFTKTIGELETHFDKWLYVLKNLENLTDKPTKLQERIFTKLFEQTEIANFDDDEYSEYEESLKAYRDLKNSFDTAREEGGKEEKITIAGKLKRQNIPPEIICRSTGLPIEEIEELYYSHMVLSLQKAK